MIIIVYYIFAIIGIYLFNTVTQAYIADGEYQEYSYADFDSFTGGLLILFQVMIEANWPDIVYDYGNKFQSLSRSVFFFSCWYLVI